jgi:hypothetical protein
MSLTEGLAPRRTDRLTISRSDIRLMAVIIKLCSVCQTRTKGIGGRRLIRRKAKYITHTYAV